MQRIKTLLFYSSIHDAYLDVYDLKRLVDIQHRHHLKTCCDPLVSVLVHPYWFRKADFDKKGWPWYDSMKPVSESYARELGQTAKGRETADLIPGATFKLIAGVGHDIPPGLGKPLTEIVLEHIQSITNVSTET